MSSDSWAAVWLSLEVGVMVALLGGPPAIALGWLLARRTFPGKALISGLVLLPMVLPPVVTGLLLLDLFGRTSTLGGLFAGLGWPLSFSFTGAVLAALVVGLPLYVWSARVAFEAVDPRFEEVSRTLGVSPLRTFRSVTLPLAFPGLAAGAVLAFARGLGEFGATAVLAGDRAGETRTIAIAVYRLLDAPDGESAVRPLVVISVATSLAALVLYEALVRRQRRRLELEGGG